MAPKAAARVGGELRWGIWREDSENQKNRPKFHEEERRREGERSDEEQRSRRGGDKEKETRECEGEAEEMFGEAARTHARPSEWRRRRSRRTPSRRSAEWVAEWRRSVKRKREGHPTPARKASAAS
mgnify:CR=1 FL=1